MAMGSMDMATENLIPGHLIMSQEVNMPIFRITKWSLDKEILKKNKTEIRMVIVMKRKITSEMMTTFF